MGKTAKADDRVTIKPENDIISSNAKAFRQELLNKITGHGCEMVIDLTNVEMVDSVGLGVFIATHNALNKIDGKLVVTGTSKNIFRLFKTMGLTRHFKVISDKNA